MSKDFVIPDLVKNVDFQEDDFSDDDFGDFQEKIAAQEKLLGELRGVLKSNAEKLESKSKVVKVRARNLSLTHHFTFTNRYVSKA